MTIKEYLILEDSSEEKWEYSQGMVWAMSGASPNHAILSSNLSRVIGNLLDLEKCTMFSGDLRIRIESIDSFLRPDSSILCGPPEFSPRDKNSLINPQIIIEILSPSTEGYDRGDKFYKYSQIPSFIQYILIHQDKPVIDSFVRQEDGTWKMRKSAGIEAFLNIPSLDLHTSLKNLYLGLRNLNPPLYFSDQEE